MNWVSVIFFFLSLFIVGTMFPKNADPLSPGRIFGLVWSVLFGFANLKLSRLQLSWTIADWGYALMGPVLFLIGVYVAFALNIGSPLKSKVQIRKAFGNLEINEEKLFAFIIILFASYIGGYLLTYLVKGYVPIFAPNPSAARIDYFIFGIGLCTHHMPLIVFFAVVYHIFGRKNRRRRRILKIIMGVTILTYLFLLQRYQLIMVAIMVFTLLYYASYHMRLKRILIFATFAIFVVYSVATIRAGQVIEFVLYKTSFMRFPPQYAIFTEPYMYIVMNIENFIHAVRELHHVTFGYFTFDWLFALLQMKYPLREYFGLTDTPYTIGGYNTHTFFWTFYRDFGVLGISLFSMMCGLGVGSVYYALRRNPTLKLLSVYCVMVFLMGLSFFLNPLPFLWFVYIVVWMVIILKFICPVGIRPAKTQNINAVGSSIP